ncbi:NAD-dependent epimerase/dehydratase family protein [Kribbella sandramycini]|uniref:NAD-dependent epimerase/dehydratase family protein n=1 Tax=Kribbella sandramycini TaxID=60450 RepID=A0A7Y4NZX4_9ACTN|nr:NAD-dependent epimerase/dehydratase family protein [Kribbella sandramycini]MBB6569631.1 nucleoside-diphosphate-sugar epimerase [Kribbella sandramycini]NOL40535.1 NAD-dependent epimerase/dehydratase family protein [Kribbella sandramycini]
MRVVVTGASGNVGTALVRRLGADQHTVVGISRRPPDLPGIQWHTADLSSDEGSAELVRAFDGADAVVHAAWAFQPSHDLNYLRRIDVGGTRRVLEAVGEAGVPHLIHLSSIGAYAAKRSEQPVGEDWPTDGIATSSYSRHKAAAERLLDAFEGGSTVVTRIRPGIVGQRSAGSAFLRYALPAVVPAKALDLVRVLPLDRALAVPVVHADDVADAITRAIERRIGGAFNLAAAAPVTVDMVAAELSARNFHVPYAVLRGLLAASWRTHLQPLSPGWLDLAYSVPLLNTARVERELGWRPKVLAHVVLHEIVEGLREAAAARTPVLRPRSVVSQVTEAFRSGPVARRRRT